VRRIALLPFAVLAVAIPTASVTGCGCRPAGCPEPQIDLVVSAAIAAVEICGDADDCVTAAVGESSIGSEPQPVTVQPPPPERSWVLPLRRGPDTRIVLWTFRTFDAQGNVLIEQKVASEVVAAARGCRCQPNLQIEVLPNEIRQTGVA
jgi:hypothetical protein